MRTFLTGLLIGAAIVAALWMTTVAVSPVSETPHENVAPEPDHVAEPPVAQGDAIRAREPVARPRVQVEPRGATDAGQESSPDAPFPPGEFVLHIGEGYVFGDDHALPRGALRPGDVTCLDLREDTADLDCPHGGCAADLVLGAGGVPQDAAGAAELVTDAPDDIAPGDIELRERTAPAAHRRLRRHLHRLAGLGEGGRGRRGVESDCKVTARAGTTDRPAAIRCMRDR